MTTPLFILGSGRCGTASLARMLSQVEGIDAHHEYCNIEVQKAAALYGMDLRSRSETIVALTDIYESAVFYSDADIWADSSHKLSWLVDPLADMFPDAKFLHIVRDGRKVASSFFNKFDSDGPDVIYPDHGVEIMSQWVNERWRYPKPPLEKAYWWKIPQIAGNHRVAQPFYDEFPTWNRFQRCCYHWQESNHAALESFKRLSRDRYFSVNLELLTTSEKVLQLAMKWAGVPYDHSMFEYLQTPRHILKPIDYKLTNEQLDQFNEIAGPMMVELGYSGADEYAMSYEATA